MNLKKAVAQGAAAVALSSATFGVGIAPANADPDWDPGWDRDEWVDQNWRNNDWQWREVDWEWKHWDDRRWHDWWIAHRWRNDDRPPWGWGAPPPLHWRGHPPPWIDYWGYSVHPIWHPHFKVLGFWLFGIFVPIIVI